MFAGPLEIDPAQMSDEVLAEYAEDLLIERVLRDL